MKTASIVNFNIQKKKVKDEGPLPIHTMRPAPPWYQSQTKTTSKLQTDIPYEHWYKNQPNTSKMIPPVY